MFNTDVRRYDYYIYGGDDKYGQPQLSEEPEGTVVMAIYLTSQSVQDNINFSQANYVGTTYDSKLNDTCVIKYGDELLKVIYVSPGRFNQVYMVKM